MKKLSKASLDSMAKMLPELDERDQRSILGGTSTGAYPEGYTGSVAVPITGYTDADPYGVTGEYTSSDFQPTGEYATGAVTTGDYSTGLMITGEYITGISSEEEMDWSLTTATVYYNICIAGEVLGKLDTPFERECLKYYLTGEGQTQTLTDEGFGAVANAEKSRRKPISLNYDFSNEEMVLIDGEMYIKRNVSFYEDNKDGSPNQFDYSLGTATMYFDTETGEAVGFYDKYDFNKEAKGVRKSIDEFATFVGNQLKDQTGAKEYDILYGKHE